MALQQSYDGIYIKKFIINYFLNNREIQENNEG